MNNLLSILGVIGVLIGIAGGVGIVLGQLRKGIVEELRASLSTARTEIDIEHTRSDRLEEEASKLRDEVVGLRAEVRALRKVRIDEKQLASTIAAALAAETARLAQQVAVEARKQTDEVLDAVREEKPGA